MSRHKRRPKREKEDKGASRSRPAPRPDRRADPASRAAAPEGFREAGNAAMSRLLGGQADRKPLDPGTRRDMEEAFGADFSDVRVRNDADAQKAAQSLDAEAFTRGNEIYLGSEAPSPESPEGNSLLAHELAHVVQQRQAPRVESRAVSEPGDSFERDADKAAGQVGQGQRADAQVSGAPPAIQRKGKRGKSATRAEAEAALRRYFEREMKAQGRANLRVTQQVQDAVQILFSEDAFGWLNIQSELNRFDLRMPYEFAGALARHLPDTVDPGLLARLDRLPARQKSPGVFGRVRRLVEQTEPGKPERPEPLPGPGSQKRFEEAMKQSQREQGSEPKERRFPPSPHPLPPKVDVLRVGRIIRGLPEAIRGPRTAAQPQPEGRSYPEVERSIEQIAPDVLIPAEARGTPQAGSFADAREFARDLAFKMDAAQQQGQDTVQERLGDNYNSVPDREEMVAEAYRIIQLVRDALPHHAASVKFVDVYFGKRLVTRGMARRSE